MFPDIDFELLYAEAGMWFGGIYFVKNSDDHCFCPQLYQVFFAKQKEEEKLVPVIVRIQQYKKNMIEKIQRQNMVYLVE